MNGKPSEYGTGIYKRGKQLWIKFYQNGEELWEPTHTTKVTIAKRLRDVRLAEVAQGKFINLGIQKVTFDMLATDLEQEYISRRRRSLKRLRISIQHLRNFFGGNRASSITTDRVRAYIIKRQKKVDDPTINRELATLKRMFNLAMQSTPPKVQQKPYIPMLKENEPRKGFFEHHEYRAVRDQLKGHLKIICTVGYFTGMRDQEVLKMEKSWVDLMEREINIPAWAAKNGTARSVPLNDELFRMLSFQMTQRPDNPLMFCKPDGSKIGGFRCAWKAACREAGYPDKLFHDFRRTAARNMSRAGVPETVIMAIIGHKTRSMFDRYNITSKEDKRNAMEKLTEYVNLKASEPVVKAEIGQQLTIGNV